MTAPAPRTFRPDIEGLRAVAIVTVVLYHYDLLRADGGFVGVDVFFVISGFLITRQLVTALDSSGRRALPTFYSRRIKRLLPAASVALLATVVAARVWGYAALSRATATDAVYTTFYGLNYRLAHLGTPYFQPLSTPPPLQHFWSLAVEEQFYLVWPWLILIVFCLPSVRRRRNLAVALAAVGAVSLVLSWRLSESTPSWAFFGLHTRAWELAAGAIVALAAQRLERLPAALAAFLTWAGLAGIGYATFRFSNATTYPGLAALIPVTGSALVIGGGCAAPQFGAGLILNRWAAQLTGRLSYSWYLWHFPIIILAPIALHNPLVTSTRLGLFAASFCVAALSFLLVEQPMRRQQWRPRRWFAFAAASAAVVCAVAAVIIAFPKSSVGPGPAAALPQVSGSLRNELTEIKGAVSTSLAMREVPDNLTPDLVTAFGDGPHSGNCFLGPGVTDAGPCVFGDRNASRSVVMFGDSLMEQWLPALDQLGKQNHWRVVMWTKAACPIIDTPSFGEPAATSQHTADCARWRDETIRLIQQLDPQVVIASNSLVYDQSTVSAGKWATLTEATLAAIAAPGRTLGYVLPDPYGGGPNCLAIELTDVGACTTPLSTATFPADRRAALATSLPEAGVHVIDPARLMCVRDECPAIVGNVPVYRDGIHVTATYARFLAPMFASFMPPG